MSPRAVTISYETVPNSDDWEKTIKTEVNKLLPLKNIHWKSASRSIRTVQSLDVVFRPLSEYDAGKELDGPFSLLDRPYLNVLFVLCEDNEIYRASVRPQIRTWLDKIQSKPSQEWLIVNVTSNRNTGSNFFQRKGSVLDKIRADFNTSKRDRCVLASHSAAGDDPTAWAEFTVKIKEGVVNAFDTNVSVYEEDVRKADSQRQLKGWQYLTFFLQKEALAECFESMTLLEDALIQIDELEASFFQALKENKMTFAGSLGSVLPGDDSSPLLDISKKSYRKLLIDGNIGLFDFRTYLFARQAELLDKLGRSADLAKRGAYFISSFARTLRENQRVLGANFVESWTYNACLNIVSQCQLKTDALTGQSYENMAFIAIEAELLDLARKQLDKLGIQAGHLPFTHPFSMSVNTTSPGLNTKQSGSDRPCLSRADLIEAMSKRDVFDELYNNLTNRCIRAYHASNRKRCSLKLHVSLAALENYRGRASTAQKLYSHLPAHYVDLRWTKIESSLLAQCSRLQGDLGMSRERLLSTLALVRAGVEYGSKKWALEVSPNEHSIISTPNADQNLAEKLMGDVYALSGELNKDFAAIAFPTFSMRLDGSRGSSVDDEDGVAVSLWIHNLLPCSLDIDEVRLKFASPENEQVWFTSGPCQLKEGENRVTLFTPIAVSGRLALEISQIRFSRIIFQYSHRPTSNHNLAPDPRSISLSLKQPTIDVTRDHRAADVFTEIPRAIHLDRDRHAIICFSSGRNHVLKAVINVSLTDSSTILLKAEAVAINEGVHVQFLQSEDALVIENLSPFDIVKIKLPISGNFIHPAIDMTINVDYFTTVRPSVRRHLRRNVNFPISLPLSVNVQDFFRNDCLLSKYSIRSDGRQGLILKDAKLETSIKNELEVKSCRSGAMDAITVLPMQTANFSFKLRRLQKTLRSRKPLYIYQVTAIADPYDTAQLHLTVRYCSIEEDYIARIRSAANEILNRGGSLDLGMSRWLVEAITREIIRSSPALRWQVYQDGFNGAAFVEAFWAKEMRQQISDPSQVAISLSTTRSIYEHLSPLTLKSSLEDSPWRSLTIPVDLPSLNILNLVHIQPACTKIEMGQPVPVTIRVHPSFTWSKDGAAQEFQLCYNVSPNPQDWLVRGRKKGEFLAKHDGQVTILLSLVPLRPGALFLPAISILPVSASLAGITCETQHLNAATSIECYPMTRSTTFNVDLNLNELVV